KAVDEIPVIRMLSTNRDHLARRTGLFVDKLGKSPDLTVEIVDGRSAVGGGAAPDFQPETVLLALTHKKKTTGRLEHNLRNSTPPVIARIVDDKVLLDLRTVSENEEGDLLNILSTI